MAPNPNLLPPINLIKILLANAFTAYFKALFAILFIIVGFFLSFKANYFGLLFLFGNNCYILL